MAKFLHEHGLHGRQFRSHEGVLNLFTLHGAGDGGPFVKTRGGFLHHL